MITRACRAPVSRVRPGSGGAGLGPEAWFWMEKAVEGVAIDAINMHVDKRGWLAWMCGTNGVSRLDYSYGTVPVDTLDDIFDSLCQTQR